jgi:hypothetical protein
MAAWTAGIVLALGLAWFVGAVVVPVWQVRGVLRRNASMEHNWIAALADGPQLAAQLGSSQTATHKLAMYIQVPRFVAPRKQSAMYLLLSCGEEGYQSIRTFFKVGDVEQRVCATKAVLFMKGIDVIAMLMEALADSDPQVRLAALAGADQAIQVLEISESTRAIVLGKLAEIAKDDPNATARAQAEDLRARIKQMQDQEKGIFPTGSLFPGH